MNSNYVKGVAFERSIVKKLEAQGFYAVRSAGSHSMADVVGVKNGLVKLIQAKTTKKKDFEGIVKNVLNDFSEDFLNKVCNKNVDVEVWVKGPGKDNVLVVSVL